MKVPISWLRDYVEITGSLEQLVERLTLAGLEVEAIEHTGDWWDRDRIVVAEVVEVRPHPDADRLVLADVDYGRGAVEQCVTGAPNLFPYRGVGRVSLKVAFAMEGAEIYDGHQAGFVKTRLKRTKIRGVPSRAMVCSEKELGISDEHEGILFLPDDAPVGMPLTDYLGDTILDISLTPNLARCLSVIGVAREVVALTGASLRLPSTEWRTDGPPAANLARVVIEDPSLCARYIATVIQGVQIGPSPRWMQERLHRVGMRPISNIVDITNYVMLEWGQPMHAFDYDKLAARASGGVPTITIRCARPGETLTTLDGVQRDCTEDTLLICDTAGPIAVAGVMGGLDTEVDASTHNILLESANFDMISVRRTTQLLRLPSEASLRFGRGIHPALSEPAARRASELMRILAGGAVAQGMVDAYPRPFQPVVIALTTADVKRVLGMDLGAGQIADLLSRLEFKVEAAPEDLPASALPNPQPTPHSLRVTVPDHRIDCQCAADLIEEVARVYGYDRIPATEMSDRLPPQRSNRSLELEETVRDILVACGLQELITYSLTSRAREASLEPDRSAEDLPPDGFVTLTNPITQDRSVMRRHLLATVLEAAAANLRFRDRVALFEVGRVFLPRPGQELPEEPRRVCLVMAGPREPRHWLPFDSTDLGFFDLKGVVEALLSHLHVAGASYEPVQHPSLQLGRAAQLRLNGVPIGILGELHPNVREAFELIGRRVAAAEFDLEALLAQVPPAWFVEPISPYPAVLQDLAVVVDEATPAAAVQRLIADTGGYLLKEIRLFDVYLGAPIPPGKKSLAFALTFQAPNKTLSDDLVARQVERIVDRLGQQLGAVLRGA